jgi:hypothetical protein
MSPVRKLNNRLQISSGPAGSMGLVEHQPCSCAVVAVIPAEATNKQQQQLL